MAEELKVSEDVRSIDVCFVTCPNCESKLGVVFVEARQSYEFACEACQELAPKVQDGLVILTIAVEPVVQ